MSRVSHSILAIIHLNGLIRWLNEFSPLVVYQLQVSQGVLRTELAILGLRLNFK
jgi:hypothetical protein